MYSLFCYLHSKPFPRSGCERGPDTLHACLLKKSFSTDRREHVVPRLASEEVISHFDVTREEICSKNGTSRLKERLFVHFLLSDSLAGRRLLSQSARYMPAVGTWPNVRDTLESHPQYEEAVRKRNTAIKDTAAVAFRIEFTNALSYASSALSGNTARRI